MRLMTFCAMCLFSYSTAFASSLSVERVLELNGHKTSIYSNQGIFFYKSSLLNAVVKNIRAHYTSKRGFERIVIDFVGDSLPSIYGHISADQQKVYIDILNAKADAGINSSLGGNFLKTVDLYSLDTNNVSLEFNFKSTYSFDIFYLNSPARLVIDVKK